jgi:Domain of unknown function (DUF5666)
MKYSVLIVAIALAVSADQVAAAPKMKPKVAVAQARVLSKETIKFKKFFSRLSAADKLKVLEYLDRRDTLSDSDRDGISDVLEGQFGSNLCDDDSDDDGLHDGNEVKDGNDPWDSDSDDDGVSDGLEVNVHGSVESVQEGVFRVKGVEFQLTSETVFGDGLSAESIVVGLCLEVEGHRSTLGESSLGGIVTAKKIKLEDGCK